MVPICIHFGPCHPDLELISQTFLSLILIGTYWALSHVQIYFIDQIVHLICLTYNYCLFYNPEIYAPSRHQVAHEDWENIPNQPTLAGP